MNKQSVSASIHVQDAEIAKTVIMPGDPLRAKFIAEHYLENPVCFNTVRNMFGYTGTYKGKMLSVMGHGMGCPSISIYATELYSQFDVECIIRIGSAGAIQPDIELGDMVIAMSCATDSGMANALNIPCTLAPTANYPVLAAAVKTAGENKIPCHVGTVCTSDYFYHPQADFNDKLAKLGVLAVEMEVAALYLTAAIHGKKALGMVTISDQLVTHKAMTALERQESFRDMMTVALETAWAYCGE